MRSKTAGILLALMLTTPFSSAWDDETGLLAEVTDSAPLICQAEFCGGAGCVRDVSSLVGDYAQAAGCGRGDCKNWQSWQVEGDYDEGSGTVHFYVACGDSEVIDCDASTSGVSCRSGIDGPGDEHFACLYRIVDGEPIGVDGRCKDPANPDLIYLAVAEGIPYDINKYVLVRGEDGEWGPPGGLP